MTYISEIEIQGFSFGFWRRFILILTEFIARSSKLHTLDNTHIPFRTQLLTLYPMLQRHAMLIVKTTLHLPLTNRLPSKTIVFSFSLDGKSQE